MKAQQWGRIVSFSMANAEQLIAPTTAHGALSKQGRLASAVPLFCQADRGGRHHDELRLARVSSIRAARPGRTRAHGQIHPGGLRWHCRRRRVGACATCCRKRRAMSAVPTYSSAAHGVSRTLECRKEEIIHSTDGRPMAANERSGTGAWSSSKRWSTRWRRSSSDAIRLYKNRSTLYPTADAHTLSGLGL